MEYLSMPKEGRVLGKDPETGLDIFAKGLADHVSPGDRVLDLVGVRARIEGFTATRDGVRYLRAVTMHALED